MNTPLPLRRLRLSRQHALLGCLLVGLACEDDVERPRIVPRIGASLQADTTGAPHYYYGGKPVYLQADPTRLVVASTALTSAQTVSDVVGSHNVQVMSATPMIQATGHWLVQLAAGTAPSAAASAVRTLKGDPRVAFASTAYRTVVGQHDFVPVNRLGVIFKPGVSQAQIDALNAAFGTRITRPPHPEWGFKEYWLAYPTDSLSDFLTVAAAYRQSALVQMADPDRTSDIELSSVPSDPYFPLQYYLANTATLNGIPVDDNVEQAWDLMGGFTDPVVVVDMGVDASHEDLNVLCGFDAFKNSPDVCPCSDCATSPLGNDSHGTACAGIVAAKQNNTLGISGIAPHSSILPIRILRGGVGATDWEIADGFAWAVELYGERIFSNSWSRSLYSQTIADAINQFSTDDWGAIFVFSAGNTYHGPPNWLAQLPRVLSVGAIDRYGSPTEYTAFGAISLVAPSGEHLNCGGGDVVTTDLMGSAGCNGGQGVNENYTGTFTGTSAAAPQVAGVLALLLSTSYFTASQARQRILNATDYWGPSTYYGAGKLNALFTVSPLEVSVSGPTDIETAAGTYTWTAHASDGTGSYTYQWQYSTDGGSSWTQLGTGPSQDRYVDQSTPAFLIRTTVTSGSLSRSSSPALCCSVTWGPLTTVGVGGPTWVWIGGPCTWNGAVTTGTPPYTFEWDVDGQGDQNPVQVDSNNGSDVFTYTANSVANPFTIWLTVTDATGRPGSTSLEVNPAGYGCGVGP